MEEERLVIGPKFEKMGVGSWHIRTRFTTRFPIHAGMFLLIRTRIWWVSGLHGNLA